MAKLDASLPVAMFDSGVGGLTVLHECLVSLPQEDSRLSGRHELWFPYGTRDPDALRERIARSPSCCSSDGAKLFRDRLQHRDLDRRSTSLVRLRGSVESKSSP